MKSQRDTIHFHLMGKYFKVKQHQVLLVRCRIKIQSNMHPHTLLVGASHHFVTLALGCHLHYPIKLNMCTPRNPETSLRASIVKRNSCTCLPGDTSKNIYSSIFLQSKTTQIFINRRMYE